jgi:hypothetical protein
MDLNELTDGGGGGAACGMGSFWIEDAYSITIGRYVNPRMASTYLICNWFYWNFVFPRW